LNKFISLWGNIWSIAARCIVLYNIKYTISYIHTRPLIIPPREDRGESWTIYAIHAYIPLIIYTNTVYVLCAVVTAVTEKTLTARYRGQYHGCTYYIYYYCLIFCSTRPRSPRAYVTYLYSIWVPVLYYSFQEQIIYVLYYYYLYMPLYSIVRGSTAVIILILLERGKTPLQFTWTTVTSSILYIIIATPPPKTAIYIYRFGVCRGGDGSTRDISCPPFKNVIIIGR